MIDIIICIIIGFVVWYIDITYLKPRRQASKFADEYWKLCTPPPLLWVNRKTNSWETRPHTQEELWRLCYNSKLKVLRGK